MGDFDSYLNYLKKSKKIIRLSVLGDGAVGKTSIIQLILQQIDSLNLDETKTSRTPFMQIETLETEGISIQVYDLAGQRIEGAHPIDLIPDQVFGSIDIILLVFSLNRYQSFENLDIWLSLIDEQINKIESSQPQFFLIGNKIDMERRIDQGLIDSVLTSNTTILSYVETSAITGEGIEDLIYEIIKFAKKKLEDDMK